MASSNIDPPPNFSVRVLNRVTNTYIRSGSIIETNPTPADLNDENGHSLTWVNYLGQADRLLSGGLLRLCYDLINSVLLFLGLYLGTKTCGSSSALVNLSIIILVANGLTLLSTFFFVIRNWNLLDMCCLPDEPHPYQYSVGYLVRGFFRLIRFICICVGTGYTFTSKTPTNNDCEIVRFYLGIVCFNAWLLILNSIPKPSLPIRRSLISECFVIVLSLIFNGLHLGSVLFALIKDNKPECTYIHIEDLYFRAPLKSFAYIGLIVLSCFFVGSTLATIIDRLFYRLPNLRRLFFYLSAASYAIIYLTHLFHIYYYSVGAVLLFHPRLGGSCRMTDHSLYTTLLTWQIIRSFLLLMVLILALLISCFGWTVGSCLVRRLPASMVVPLMETVVVCFCY